MNSRLPLAFQFLLFSLSFFNPIFVCTELTAHFRQFLNENYGDGFADQMARNDMGVGLAGSFGGKWNGQEAIENQVLMNIEMVNYSFQPVIFIHGVTLRAAIFMAHRNFFLNKGYSSAELYATTYSDGGKTPFYYNDLRCENVKQVRSFIIAVHEYSNKSVDIIAYSMGAAISRKAILGGRCAETGENLGPPLTPYIDTYVSVGGVAYGMERCPENLPACNAKNGMLCTSDYMKNVNGQKGRYEGNISFGISSSDDFIVGQHCCGHQCSELKNADQNILFSHFDHITLFSQTVPLQYSLVTSHKVIDPK